MKKKTTMTTALGERLRDLAEEMPEHAFELRRQADLFDEASHGYFVSERQMMSAKQFMAVWTKTRRLHDSLTESEMAA